MKRYPIEANLVKSKGFTVVDNTSGREWSGVFQDPDCVPANRFTLSRHDSKTQATMSYQTLTKYYSYVGPGKLPVPEPEPLPPTHEELMSDVFKEMEVLHEKIIAELDKQAVT